MTARTSPALTPCPACCKTLEPLEPDDYVIVCRNPDCPERWEPRQLHISELLNESIEIGSKVWKDIPDAAEHIRKKRDGECCRCGTTREHPDPLSCPYEP